MGRWAPDARGRLERAAFELFAAQGYENTTVAEIAQRAGLTERTFFRHFTDKREVLFSGASYLQAFLLEAVDRVPGTTAPLETIMAALDDAARSFFDDAYDFARQRRAIVASSTELTERELVKLVTLAEALAGALRRRGVKEPAATLAAEAGIAVFRVAFEAWTASGGELSLAEHIRAAGDELRAMSTPGRSAGRRQS